MGKVVAMFAEFSERWREEAEARRHADAGGERGRLPGTLPPTEPKISKGENYKGLPWVMLDYPRVFGREDVCAIRTMFWWGHAFSVTLHLKGEYMRVFLPVIRARRAELSAAGFLVAISDDEWAHEHTQETYGPLHEGERPFEGTVDLRSGSSVRGLAGQGEATERSWFKLSARCGLNRWEEAPELLTGWHGMLMRVLATGSDDHR
jgi:hypothetical protein